MIREVIIKAVQNTLSAMDVSESTVQLEHPTDEKFGDYSTNIALKVKNDKTNPRALAEQIITHLQKDSKLKQYISKIEIAGPGFINFWIQTDWIVENISEISKKGDAYGTNKELAGKLILFEFPDPNPFKEFHIGHLYDASVGESFSRIYEAAGATVKRVNYQGDVGMHVAKSIWGMRKKMSEENSSLDILTQKDLKARVKFMGQAYALGDSAFTTDEVAKEEIKQLNKKIYDLDSDVKEIYETGRQWSLDYFETIYKRLGTKHDQYYFEREAGTRGLALVQEYLAKGIFEKSEGAVVFNGEKYGLHTRVFINSQGLPTYEAKDVGLPVSKYEDYKYDLSVIITANEVNEYFKVVITVLGLINPELGNKTKHISHGMVKLPQGKMSSRTGNVITGESLIEEVKTRVFPLINKNETLSDEEKDHIAEITAVGAIKYSLLKVSVGKDVIFDINESISFDGNSGPYLQYAYARTRSLLKKAQKKISPLEDTNYEINNEESSVLRTLYKYPEVVAKAAETFSPNLIANYLYDVAQKYNLFYQKVPILTSSDIEKNFRLALTSATSHVLKNGLNLLGISVLEKM